MTRAMRFLVLALLATPVLVYLAYRVARGLGFMDPPWNKEHEYRRTIIAAIYALLLFFPILLFGYANAWPRAWWMFGVINALGLLAFAGMGTFAALRLWRLRHPNGASPRSEDSSGAAPTPPDGTAGKPLL